MSLDVKCHEAYNLFSNDSVKDLSLSLSLPLSVDLKVTCDKMIAIVETTINYCCNTGGFLTCIILPTFLNA